MRYGVRWMCVWSAVVMSKDCDMHSMVAEYRYFKVRYSFIGIQSYWSNIENTICNRGKPVLLQLMLCFLPKGLLWNKSKQRLHQAPPNSPSVNDYFVTMCETSPRQNSDLWVRCLLGKRLRWLRGHGQARTSAEMWSLARMDTAQLYSVVWLYGRREVR